MAYILQEEGKTRYNRAFRRYKAVLSPYNNISKGDDSTPFVSTRDWATAIATRTSTGHIFLSELNRVIRESPYEGVFFETPPVTAATADTQPFEFVLVDAPDLHKVASASPNVDAFGESFAAAAVATTKQQAVAFLNLRGDATLVSPTPPPQTSLSASSSTVSLATYSHLAAFVRGAPDHQVSETWRTVAHTYLTRLSLLVEDNQQAQEQQEPLWLSTAGLGIYWLHVRLDKRPKYYKYEPYKSFTAPASS